MFQIFSTIFAFILLHTLLIHLASSIFFWKQFYLCLCFLCKRHKDVQKSVIFIILSVFRGIKMEIRINRVIGNIIVLLFLCKLFSTCTYLEVDVLFILVIFTFIFCCFLGLLIVWCSFEVFQGLFCFHYILFCLHICVFCFLHFSVPELSVNIIIIKYHLSLTSEFNIPCLQKLVSL